MNGKENKEVVINLWDSISSNRWDEVELLLSDKFEAYWPQSKKKMDRDEFIAFNKKISENKKLQILNVNHDYDQWDHISTVITQVSANSSLEDGKRMDSHIISFFEVEDEKIIGLVEYRT